MDFRPVTRARGAFQQSVTPEEIETICRRAFGTNTKVTSATELGTGMYKTTHRVTVAGQERWVILRIASEPERQFTSERALMTAITLMTRRLAQQAPDRTVPPSTREQGRPVSSARRLLALDGRRRWLSCAERTAFAGVGVRGRPA
ncbi:hypothetical protein [Streptomyces sp. NPDC001851]|uniref:hypothetical protein n=1 Tax=Streptomyces sp. NPDC001851 TaxID=3154529 RepID=UPI00331FA2AB